ERKQGEVYAGRRIVYEDCRRAEALTIGPELVERLARPLTMLFQSANWLTGEIARTFRARFSAIYRERARESGVDAIGLPDMMLAAQPLLYGGDSPVDPALAELQARWLRLLDVDGDGACACREVRRTTAELDARC